MRDQKILILLDHLRRGGEDAHAAVESRRPLFEIADLHEPQDQVLHATWACELMLRHGVRDQAQRRPGRAIGLVVTRIKAHDNRKKHSPARFEQQSVEEGPVFVESQHRLHKFVTCERKARMGEDFRRRVEGRQVSKIDIHG